MHWRIIRRRITCDCYFFSLFVCVSEGCEWKKRICLSRDRMAAYKKKGKVKGQLQCVNCIIYWALCALSYIQLFCLLLLSVSRIHTSICVSCIELQLTVQSTTEMANAWPYLLETAALQLSLHMEITWDGRGHFHSSLSLSLPLQSEWWWVSSLVFTKEKRMHRKKYRKATKGQDNSVRVRESAAATTTTTKSTTTTDIEQWNSFNTITYDTGIDDEQRMPKL